MLNTAILTVICKMNCQTEQRCHRTQPSGACEVNKIALHSCTYRETMNSDKCHHRLSFDRNASFVPSEFSEL